MCTVHCALHTLNIANLHRVRSAKFTQCTGSAKFAQCTHSAKFIHSTHWILQIYTVYTQCIIYTVNAQCKINTGYAQCKCIIERKSHYLPCLLNRRSSTHLDLPDLNCIVLCAWLENQKPAVKACQLAPISKCNGAAFAFSISITIKCSILHPSPSHCGKRCGNPWEPQNNHIACLMGLDLPKSRCWVCLQYSCNYLK